MQCLNCSTETKNPRFCSRSCSASYNNKGKARNPPVERICKKCGEIFCYSYKHRSVTFCKECLISPDVREDYFKSLTIGKYRNSLSVKGKHPSWVHAHVRNQCRSWNKDLVKSPCEVCGYSIHTELCHIKPISSFDDNATLGEINHPDNLRVLCRNHHWEFDHNLLDL